MMTNESESQQLVPQTSVSGRVLEYDFPSFQVGIAEYAEGPTGCTVFTFPGGAEGVYDERGGLVGRSGEYPTPDALFFAGGSTYGLEVGAGVTAELFARLHPSPFEGTIAVNGAILFDFGPRHTLIYPDKALGRAATAAARPNVFPLGACGAGRSASCGGVFDFARAEPSGQGGAFRQIGETKLAVFTVVNALGVVVNRNGEVVRGNRNPESGARVHPLRELEQRLASGQPTVSPGGNTTLTLLVTNQRLDRRALHQLGRQVHSSLARAIVPFHTLMDGDVCYTVTTNEVENPGLSVAALGLLASELAWDAVLSIYEY